jgi:hypothetical protein
MTSFTRASAPPHCSYRGDDLFHRHSFTRLRANRYKDLLEID